MVEKSKKQKNRELIYKALTDPEFRKKLQETPEKALKVKQLPPEKKAEIKMILEKVKQIESDVTRIADQLLCANGGNCGIA